MSKRYRPIGAFLWLASTVVASHAQGLTCDVTSVNGPYTPFKNGVQIKVHKTTVVVRSGGVVLAVYTISTLGPGFVQIKLDNQPLSSPGNPLGAYPTSLARATLESFCPNLSQFVPVKQSPRAEATGTALTSPSGQAATADVSADFNNDGVPDDALSGPGYVQVTLYNSSGSTAAPQRINIGGSSPGIVVVADFNGDGKADLAVAYNNNSSQGMVAVLIGNGDGTFAAPVNYAAGAYTLSMAAADLNGDGKPDLAVGSTNANGTAGSIQVLLGKGDGSFAAPAAYTTGNVIPQSLIAADFNGDGRPDVAALNTPLSGSSDQLLVFLSNPDGSLSTPLPATVTNTFNGSLSYADLNGDGKLDLAIADLLGSSLTVLMGNGDGSFQTPRQYVGPAQPASVGIIPFSGGGAALLAADAIDGSFEFTTVEPDGAVDAAAIQALGKSLTAIAAVDVNRDGKPDIVVTDRGGNRVWVILNSGNYSFATPVGYTLNASPSATAVADVNGDGIPDLIVADANGVDILAGKSDGTFGPPQNSPVTGASGGIAGPVTADLNGDGKADVAVATGGQIAILLGQGTGSFSPAATIPLSGSVTPAALVTGDFNGDGKPDLALAYTANGSGFLEIALGDGKGGFQTSTIALPAEPISLAAGDLNKDRKLDLVAGTNSSGAKALVLLGNGDGTFQPPVIYSTGAFSNSIAIVDYDGDGSPDLILGDCCGLSEAAIMLGNGDGTFQSADVFPSGPNPAYLAAADFDGDGKPDLAIAGGNKNGGTLVILRNDKGSQAGAGTPNGATVVSAANPTGTAIAPASLAVIYGSNLSTGATSLPLPSSFSGTSVSIEDAAGVTTAAPLVYVSAAQIDFEVPAGVAIGAATITVTNGAGAQSVAKTTIAAVAPGVFTLNASNLAAAIAIRVGADGTQTVEQVYSVDASGAVVAAPINMGSATDQVVLSIFATGLRAAGTTGVSATVGGVPVTVQYAGAQGSYDGLDQVNLILPRSLAGKGSVTIQLTANGAAANAANVTLQ